MRNGKNSAGMPCPERLLRQPDDGVMPLLQAINAAKESVDIVIFRFDHAEIEKALAAAVRRGVTVRALIAHLNSSGEENLRKLETRLLDEGVTVARTGGDYLRYHAKLLIIDGSELYLLSFNFTKLDIARSRSFGLVFRDPKIVNEALTLIQADIKRQPYQPGHASFVVSPDNARQELAAFIEGAQQQLLIYDPKIADPAMLRTLQERASSGVEVRVIGQISAAANKCQARRLPSPRLHTRVIIRDGRHAFVGSQSLRELELDRRREAGVIFEGAAFVNELMKTFEEDWEVSKPGAGVSAKPEAAPVEKLAKRVAKAVTKELPPIAPVIEGTIKEMGVAEENLQLDEEIVEEAVRDAVKDAVREAVEDVVHQASRVEPSTGQR